MPRGARLDAPGTLHHVIVRGIEGRNIVSDDRDRKNFVARMGALAKETRTSIFAWALMTNHAHMLLRSAPSGLSAYMRRLLTGYAIAYNRRHDRYGYLFQNRYKSIVCEEDPYFKELVRYIHLNPLRANVIESLPQLERYAWCGHGVVLGRRSNDWQGRDYVLKWFGNKEGEARKAYRAYVKEGISHGRRPDLVGGGLIRSMGGWSAVKAMRRSGIREKGDERILGSGEFVEHLLEQAEANVRQQFRTLEKPNDIERMIEVFCRDEGIGPEALRCGSRVGTAAKVRAKLAQKLVFDFGYTLADTGRALGVSTSAVSKLIRRKVD